MDKNKFLKREKYSRDAIDFKKVYVDISGDLIAWLMLSQILYRHLPKENWQSKLRVVKEWVERLAKSDKDWYDEVRITPAQARRARWILQKKWLIISKNFKFNWTPTTHVRVNWDCLIEQMDLSYNTNWNDTQHKSITESTTENTTEINIDSSNSKNSKLPTEDNQSTSWDEYQEALKDFILMRKQIKKPMTDRAINILEKKLDRIARNEKEKIAILEKSIFNAWQNIFPLDTPIEEDDDKQKFLDICFPNNSFIVSKEWKQKYIAEYGEELYERYSLEHNTYLASLPLDE